MGRGWGFLFIISIGYFSPLEARQSKQCADVTSLLSSIERTQLGTSKILKNGERSEFKYPSHREWVRLRKILVARSKKSNPLLDPEFTAYTPGETLKLMKKTKIREWHKKMANWKVPADAEWIVFVPCAKTKPWDDATIGLYGNYNQIRAMRDDGKIGKVYFVTISEPLGVVPEDFWGTFPHYDNPGLFSEEAMRSGLMTADWPSIGFPNKRIVPFDAVAYKHAIQKLGEVIAKFLRANSNKKFVSFVEDFDGVSTHSDMLNTAGNMIGASIDLSRRFTKRPAPRQQPKEHILRVFKSLGIIDSSYQPS
jgi:hypothetical protein